MATKPPAVEPYRGPVVDRVEAEDPVAEAARYVAREGAAGGKREVLAVPPDVPGHAQRRQIVGVVRVGHRHRRPAVGRRRRCATTRPTDRGPRNRGATAIRHSADSGRSARRGTTLPWSAAGRRRRGPARGPGPAAPTSAPRTPRRRGHTRRTRGRACAAPQRWPCLRFFRFGGSLILMFSTTVVVLPARSMTIAVMR